MSGKGSDRRPTLVTPAQASRNWERTFAKPKQAEPDTDKKAVSDEG